MTVIHLVLWYDARNMLLWCCYMAEAMLRGSEQTGQRLIRDVFFLDRECLYFMGMYRGPMTDIGVKQHFEVCSRLVG